MIDLNMKLDQPPYDLDNGYRLHIYNKGGFFTVDAPIKRQLKEINNASMMSNKAMQKYAAAQNEEERSRFSMLADSFRKKDSFQE